MLLCLQPGDAVAADLRNVSDSLPASGRQHGASQTDPLLHHPPLPRLSLRLFMQDRLRAVCRSEFLIICRLGLTDNFSLYSFILERKRTRKRRRLEWMHSLPMYVFILSSGKDQSEFSLSRSL